MLTLRSGIATSVLAVTLLIAPATSLAAAPTIGKITVIKRSTTSLVITASVHPRRDSTSVTIAFGRDGSLGTRSSPVALTAGNDPLTVTMTLSGLEPGTTYYYRFTATNSGGTTRSGVRTADTTGGTPAPDPEPDPEPAEPRLMPRLQLSFAIETIRTGSTIGTILAATRPRGLPKGTKVTIRCHSRCTGGRSFFIRANSPTQYRLRPAIRISRRSVVEIRAVRKGYVGRIQRATFSRSGVLIESRAVLNACLSAKAPTRIITCPR